MSRTSWRDAAGDSGNGHARSEPRRVPRTSTEHLDVDAALEIVEAVAGETDLESLVGTVVRLAVEHAGAERGMLVLPRDDAFWVEAEARSCSGAIDVMLQKSPVSAEALPESVFHHAVRTGATVVVHDASAEPTLSTDEYVRRHGARSVLCMPMLRQRTPVGFIYLESRRAPGVFTPGRIARLRLLASQAAAALEHARLHRDLRERARKLQRLVGSNIIGIVGWHADGRVLDTNDAFLRTVGYTRAELLSGSVRWTDLTPVEWHDDDNQALQDVKNVGTVQAHEREYIRKDGTRVPVLAAGAVFDDDPNEGVAFVLDLTQARWTERAERAAERESRLIIDTIPGMVALLTATGEVEAVNHRLTEYFGQTLEELRQWGTNGSVHAEDLPHVAEVFTRSIASGSPYDIVQRFRRFDGVYRWFENRGFPLRNERGRIDRWCVLLTDIDEKKRAEDALRESERESRMIVDSIPGMVAAFTPTGELEFVNRQVREFFGKTFEELRQWGTDDTVHPEERARVAEHFIRAMASGEPFAFESLSRRFDGVYRWHQSRGAPLRGTDGRIVRWYNLIIDVDERKRAEEALAASERKLQVIIDTIPAMAWSADPDGGVDFFNQHFLDFIGFSAEQASGWGWTAAAHPDDLRGLEAAWQRIAASRAPGETEARLRRHDGAYRWFLFRVNPLRDEAGNVVKWYGVNTDIEDRKQAADALRRSEEFLLEVQRLTRTVGWRLDTATGKVETYPEVMSAFAPQPGDDTTVPSFFFGRIHPDDRARVHGEFERCLRERAPYHAAYRLALPDGSIRYQHSTGHPITNAAGAVTEFIGAATDMTEHWQATEELARASDALRDLQSRMSRAAEVATVGELAASIAHEVNQPLSGIVTNAATCLRMLDADPPNVEGARETVRRAMRDGHRASDVIARLRALFGKKALTLESMDLNEATREIVALAASDLQRNDVVLDLDLADDLPSVLGDRVQLQQVVLNLLRNASEAMAGVHDRPRRVLLRTEREDGDRVRVTVRDSGVGLGVESANKLFDAFYTTKSGGMGIGLSVSRSIVELHHGRLWAESNDGPGASFAFSVPCRTAEGA